MDLTVIQEYVKPELLILIPVLYLIGVGLKKLETIKDKFIPVLLGLFSVLLTMVYLASSAVLTNFGEVMAFAFTGITQGILIAGCSVYINQIYKQTTKEE